MSTTKALVYDASVENFLNPVDGDSKKHDSFILLEMFTRLTGEKARM